MIGRGEATEGAAMAEVIAGPPVAGVLNLSLSADLTARVKAAAAKRGETARRLVLEIVDLVFAPGPASLVDAVLDREPD